MFSASEAVDIERKMSVMVSIRKLWPRVLVLGLLAAALPGARARGAAPAETCDRAQIFYYDWYGAPPFQSGFVHWTQGEHQPPRDIGSNFYPQLGPYSSRDPAVLKQHMAWIRAAHVGVLALSWWGPGSYEDQGAAAVMDAAADAGLKVDFHIEPYKGRTPASVARDVADILARYGGHRAFYRAAMLQHRPVFYVFEALHDSAAAWRPAMDSLHRGTDTAVMIAQTSDLSFVVNGGFDGGYTYDVLTPFTKESFLPRWKQTSQQFVEAGKLFVPSVGPGYADNRAVPAGGARAPESAKTRDHGSGVTYARGWAMVREIKPVLVTITSFNEWHEGTQIEPAVEMQGPGYRYPPYACGPEDFLRQTANEVHEFASLVATHP